MCLFPFLLLVLTLGAAARAGDVQILGALPDDVYSVSKDPKREWKVNDRICFRLPSHKGSAINYRDILACGQVLDVLEEDILVHVTSRNVKLRPGVKVKAWQPGGETYSRAAEFAKRTISNLHDPLEHRVISIGGQYLAGFVHLEQGVSNNWSVGFQPSYVQADVGQGSIRGFGFHLTVGYHLEELFQGPWFLLGTGALLYRGQGGLGDFRKDSLSVHGSVGWRFWLFDTVSLGVSVGGQYVLNHTFAQFVLGWNGFLPVGLLQIGVRF